MEARFRVEKTLASKLLVVNHDLLFVNFSLRQSNLKVKSSLLPIGEAGNNEVDQAADSAETNLNQSIQSFSYS